MPPADRSQKPPAMIHRGHAVVALATISRRILSLSSPSCPRIAHQPLLQPLRPHPPHLALSQFTCSSLGPNLAAALDPLSPSFAPKDKKTFEHTRCFPVFPNTPILTFTHFPLGQRLPWRWSLPLYTLSLPLDHGQLPQEEKDVFAAVFQAAIDQVCSRLNITPAPGPPSSSLLGSS
ncbi:hypothetical protein PCANC_11670 [Puccinia coronata f. sp. avenae]|uniref:Uncharacterized protein n=1 Tax=Puccinia coronata f. sp. avenae TaxID=200324 RepID=A0A2N5T3R9_9BASI|nr:hypothetical protein PCANC_16638 [Puccinia coronata f. sp. avenae]PLW54709.1 hypothetical protein PCANC_11670 [Puccinia coronata f. sp. avenae]